jgi:3-deoxy-D-manno-octulosonic-acid transferase
VVLIGGTVRPGSGRLRWPLSRWFTPLYAGLAYAAAASEADADRLAALGVRPNALDLPGDPRHDHVLERLPDPGIFRDFGDWAGAHDVLVAGSSEPDDDPLLLDAFAQIHLERPTARLLLCPHCPSPQRTLGLVRLARERALESEIWKAGPVTSRAPVVIVERPGVLADLYGVGQIAYVGGGFGTKGLHAVIEPAAYGIPVVMGPRGHGPDAALLLAAGAAVALPFPKRERLPALTQAWRRWLAEPRLRTQAGLAARRALKTGASQHIAHRLLGLLPAAASGAERRTAPQRGSTDSARSPRT